jgi:hypothetical protein
MCLYQVFKESIILSAIIIYLEDKEGHVRVSIVKESKMV